MASIVLVNPTTGKTQKVDSGQGYLFNTYKDAGFELDMSDPGTSSYLATDPNAGELATSFGQDIRDIRNDIALDESQDIMDRTGLSDPIESFLDENGQLPPELQSQVDPLLGQSEGILQQLREQAFSTGVSPFEQAQLDSQKFGEETAREGLTGQVAGQQAGAFSQLAQAGGLESGARERLAQNFGRAGFQGQQDLTRQGMEQRLGIRAGALQRKEGLQTALPGQFTALGQARQGVRDTNIDRIISERGTTRDLGQRQKETGAELFGSMRSNPEEIR